MVRMLLRAVSYKEKFREGLGREQKESGEDKLFPGHCKHASEKECGSLLKKREDGKAEEDSSRNREEGATTEGEEEKEEGEDDFANETLRACRQAIAAGVDTSLCTSRKTIKKSLQKNHGRRGKEDEEEKEDGEEVEDLSRENNLIIQTLLDAKGIQVRV